MDFPLSEEQGCIRNTIRKFVAKECGREAVKKRDEAREFPTDLFQTLKRMGFCGLTIPESYDGGGPNALGAVLVVEELAAIYPTLAAAFIAASFCGGKTIADMGSLEQKRRLLPQLAQGELLCAYAWKEPDEIYGTSPIQTRAIPNGAGYRLNGTKLWVRLADRADYLMTVARTEDNADEKQGLTCFVVDAKQQGISIQPHDKVGFDSTNLCRVTFKNVLVAQTDILGGAEMLGRGWEQYERMMVSEHLEVAAVCVGLAQGAYAYAAQYAKERVQFGRPIVTFGAVRHLLVDAALAIRSARMLAYQAAWQLDQGDKVSNEAAMARVQAVHAAQMASLGAVQILGGYGYTMEYDAQRYLRDAVVALTGGESVEMLKDGIGASMAL